MSRSLLPKKRTLWKLHLMRRLSDTPTVPQQPPTPQIPCNMMDLSARCWEFPNIHTDFSKTKYLSLWPVDFSIAVNSGVEAGMCELSYLFMVFCAGESIDLTRYSYYCHLPPRLGSKILLLVPASQFRQLIQEINRELECQLSLPSDPHLGLVLPFREKNWYPQPVFLGKCDGQETKEQLQAKVPPPVNHGQPLPELDEQYLEYEKILEAAWETTRNKKKGSKAKIQQRAQHQQRLVQCYERTQSYLGWRSPEPESQPAALDAASWADKAKLNAPSADDWDATKPMPYPFWKEPVLISVDVECNERCHSQVTEVGLSTLDLSQLSGVPPGQQGAQWIAQIQSRHLRVREFGHIVNHDFVAGCPANFEFGTSEWVSLEQLATVVQAGLTPASGTGGEPRAVVVVGHNPSMDLAYLREMGVPVEVNSNGVIDIVDTAETWRIQRGEASPRSLGAILAELGVVGWYLHNAGNDARYTMEVLIRMMVERFSKQSMLSSS
ncbi:hypothetical protein P170DRAFT_434529 [Aspergillus steynii IBT 23096]|uniref:Gfd2/YDR514C-like C-terminal domain-containing protein n=1 Tax=Aspergillus steynii IBT 23096 TaxID=1392250 RepID=A0A2I2GIW0_9EURO|nr:uncharacterized protein P170DRAFT_434529 [Aspergillus steynii IBT 23096]PLB52809.1 hypothetical protein P170DRAFT_434529 [Aspergillus steynii IBT 23096]